MALLFCLAPLCVHVLTCLVDGVKGAPSNTGCRKCDLQSTKSTASNAPCIAILFIMYLYMHIVFSLIDLVLPLKTENERLTLYV